MVLEVLGGVRNFLRATNGVNGKTDRSQARKGDRERLNLGNRRNLTEDEFARFL